MTGQNFAAKGYLPTVLPSDGRTRWALLPVQWLVVGACTLTGLGTRAALVAAAPRSAYLWDHLDFMVWSEWAYRYGPTSLYDLSSNTLVNANVPRFLSSVPMVTPCPSLNECNYPPLSGYFFWLQGWLWHMADERVETHELLPEIAKLVGVEGGRLSSPVANTVVTRAVNAALPTLADFLMAWGVALLVCTVRQRPAGWAEVAAFGLTVLGPPIFLDSAYWTQMDACLACSLVWCLCLLARQRHAWAGVCYGVALMTKAQAILFAPVLAFAFLALVFSPGGSLRRGLQMWKTAATAVAVVAILAAPYAIADRGSDEGGCFRWYYRSYDYPIRKQYALTTLKAFNVWWLDFLAHGQDAAALRADAPVSAAADGLTKSQVGHLLLGAAVIGAAALRARRWRWQQPASIAVAFLTLLAVFVLPTRVHERYIYYCLPFLIAAAMVIPAWRPLLVTLFLVGAFEMTWFLWLAPGQPDLLTAPQSPAAAAWSLVLAVLCVGSLVYALATLVRPSRIEPAPSSVDLRQGGTTAGTHTNVGQM